MITYNFNKLLIINYKYRLHALGLPWGTLWVTFCSLGIDLIGCQLSLLLLFKILKVCLGIMSATTSTRKDLKES